MCENILTEFLMIESTFSVLIHVEFWKLTSLDHFLKAELLGVCLFHRIVDSSKPFVMGPKEIKFTSGCVPTTG